MNVIELDCPACGAPLSVHEDEMVFYCRYCGASLTVKQDENRHTGRDISIEFGDGGAEIEELQGYIVSGEERSILEDSATGKNPYSIKRGFSCGLCGISRHFLRFPFLCFRYNHSFPIYKSKILMAR